MIKNLESLVSSPTDYQIFGETAVQIKGITDDSRKVKTGYLFVAVKGENFDGHDFITQAVSRGARVVVGEKDPKRVKLKGITYIKVKSSRRALSLLASAWYESPSRKMRIIGVTGTDGKTTTANLIYWILKKAGKKVGLVSTINAIIGNKKIDTGLHVTNPEPLLLQELLAQMVKGGCEYAVLEVTSHGLDQERVAGINFEVGVLTNVSHEHLDYHQTLKDYMKAKAKLFNNSKIAILNQDDASFNQMSKLISNKIQVLPYGFSHLKGRLKKTIEKRFKEKFNQSNALAAIACAIILGVKEEKIYIAIESFPKLVGRMEEVKNDKGLKIVIDFAHTPNALENVLETLKERTSGEMISIFGCAGERDKEKRSMMGEISAKLADISIFTAEDPRSEDVNKIIDQMAKGAIKAGAKEISQSHTIKLRPKDDQPLAGKNLKTKEHLFFKIPERGEAITFAIQKLAKKGETVIICGKGHEKSMAFGEIEYPWSDQEAVKIALASGVKKIQG